MRILRLQNSKVSLTFRQVKGDYFECFFIKNMLASILHIDPDSFTAYASLKREVQMASLLKIPPLNQENIQSYVGLSNFQKGEGYAFNQAIRKGKLKNQVLTALCQGHEFDAYQVGVIFDSEGIQLSYCSCPVGGEGKCKHVAALLLTWLDKPETFTNWEKLKLDLQAYDTSTLLELIDLLDDKLQSSFEMIHGFRQNLQTVKSPRLARYMQRIDEAFHISEFQWYHPDEGGLTEITFALDQIRSDADQLLKEGQWEEAIRIEQTLIGQILNHLDDHVDPWQNLSEEIKRCIHSLDQALYQLDQQAELRQKIFQILFRLIEEQIYRNTSVGAEEAKQVILKHVKAAERDKIVSWIEALHMRRLPEEEQKHLGLEDFLIDLQKDVLDPEIYLTHYRHTNQVLKLVDSLLELGRVKEAEYAAQQREFAAQTFSLANLFIKHQHPMFAEKLVLAFSRHTAALQSARWLKEFYQQRKKFEKALEQAKYMLYLYPQLAYYQDFKDIYQLCNNHKLPPWSALRQEIINHFKHRQEDLLLIEIYLEEQDLEQAIQIFEQVPLDAFKDTQGTLLVLRLAAAARSKYPQLSLKVYDLVIENLIEERHRDSYRKACDYLKMIKAIYEDLQHNQEWNVYLKNLMQTYSRLKAFKDEIHRAKL